MAYVRFCTLDTHSARLIEQAVLARCGIRGIEDPRRIEYELDRVSFIVDDGLLNDALGESDYYKTKRVEVRQDKDDVVVEAVIWDGECDYFCREWRIGSDTVTNTPLAHDQWC